MKLFLTAMALAALPAMAAAQRPDATTFLKKAGASDRYEIESSRLVLDSRNREVRSFAQGMIRDHTKSTADVKAAAARAGLRAPPPRLDARKQRDVAALRSVRGAARDRLYVQQQKLAHREALELHQANAAGGRVPSLRAVSRNIVPVVRHHRQMLAGM